MTPVHYQPHHFPPTTIDWGKLIPYIGPASAALARYDGMLAAIPNPNVLLAPLSIQEAVLSSRIEGTQATMGEVLEYEAGRTAVSPERQDDIQEVLNYRAAVRKAEELLTELPFSGRVIRESHKVLLSGVRGKNKAPGQYRKIPNWIGPPGCTIENAHYVPIGADKLVDAMATWERYAHDDAQDRLVRLAVLHAEFEALHPFLDGNGRIGRMMIPLYLWQFKLIQKPIFYISAYFESRRDAYYEGLRSVSSDNNWTDWCSFFLESVRAQAEDNLSKAQAIFDLSQSMKHRLPAMTRSQYAFSALDWIFERPIFKTTDFIASDTIPAPTARRFLRVLRQHGVLKVLQPSRGRRAAVLVFAELLNIAEGRDLF